MRSMKSLQRAAVAAVVLAVASFATGSPADPVPSGWEANNMEPIGYSRLENRKTPPRPASSQCWAGAGMNARMLGIICALLAAMPNLIGCESSRSQDYQFEKQVKRAQECRQLQDKLVGDQPLTPERGEEITKTMDRSGCAARLPSRCCCCSPAARCRSGKTRVTPRP